MKDLTKPFLMQPIKMVKGGGIPKLDTKYHPRGENSMKRSYLYIPENEEDPNSVELGELLKQIDDYMRHATWEPV